MSAATEKIPPLGLSDGGYRVVGSHDYGIQWARTRGDLGHRKPRGNLGT